MGNMSRSFISAPDEEVCVVFEPPAASAARRSLS